MEGLFKSFCVFGGGAKDTTPVMDGPKFGKFCRDMRILDKRITSTEVDIIFAKAKQKTERKINFDQFMDAFRMIAEKKYPGDPNSVKVLERKVLQGTGPAIVGTTKLAKNEGMERMTDSTLYTGSHKERFDEEGKGRGMEGRGSTPKGKGPHASLVSQEQGYVMGYKNEGSYQGGFSGPNKTAAKLSKFDVVDRLTDSTKYTGSHKHRFDDGGQGKGRLGRDLPSKGAGMSPGSVASQQGYVSGYKNEGSYGRK